MRLLPFGATMIAAHVVAAQSTLPSAVRREALKWTDSAGTTQAIMWSPIGATKESPALLFSPGYGQTPSAYSIMLSTWASRGFVVIAISHPTLPAATGEEFYEVSQRIARQLVRALDHVIQENRADVAPFTRLDASRVGVIGHSIGGSAAAQACALELRFRACMNLDGSIFGPVVHTGMSQPFFLLRKLVSISKKDPPRWVETHDQGNLHEDSVWAHTNTMYWLTVNQMDHMAFTNSALDETRGQELKRLVGLAVSAKSTQEMTTRFVVDFFGKHMNEARGPFTLDHNPFPATTMKSKP